MPRKLLADGRTELLPDTVKTEFIVQHIPYRLELMRLGRAACPAADTSASASVEAGVVSGRLFLQFLGLGIEITSDLRLVERRDYHQKPKGITDEVKAPDIGGSFVDLSELTDQDRLLLAEFHYGASKACAHLTWDSDHNLDIESIHRAAEVIHRLVHAHCPL